MSAIGTNFGNDCPLLPRQLWEARREIGRLEMKCSELSAVGEPWLKKLGRHEYTLLDKIARGE